MNASSPERGPGPSVWFDLLADAADIAAEYREAGWEVAECDPGDVTTIDSTDHDRFGFNVLVPAEEYDAIEALFEEGAFDSVEVFSQVVEGTVYVLAVERDEDREAAITIPVFHRLRESRALFEVAADRGALPIHLRPPSGDRWVTFAHDEPALFTGEADADDGIDAESAGNDDADTDGANAEGTIDADEDR